MFENSSDRVWRWQGTLSINRRICVSVRFNWRFNFDSIVVTISVFIQALLWLNKSTCDGRLGDCKYSTYRRANKNRIYLFPFSTCKKCPYYSLLRFFPFSAPPPLGVYGFFREVTLKVARLIHVTNIARVPPMSNYPCAFVPAFHRLVADVRNLIGHRNRFVADAVFLLEFFKPAIGSDQIGDLQLFCD